MADPFTQVQADLREVVLDDREAPAWQVLDRDRVETLLNQPHPDEVGRYYLWRVATLFGPPIAGPRTGSGSG